MIFVPYDGQLHSKCALIAFIVRHVATRQMAPCSQIEAGSQCFSSAVCPQLEVISGGGNKIERDNSFASSPNKGYVSLTGL